MRLAEGVTTSATCPPRSAVIDSPPLAKTTIFSFFTSAPAALAMSAAAMWFVLPALVAMPIGS